MAERVQIIVRGIVQGVGFRPWVFNLAEEFGLSGYVTNTSEGVFIDIEGNRVTEFLQKLRNDAPPLSRITEFEVSSHPLHGYSDFTIHQSTDSAAGLPFTLVSPDVSVCNDCLHELLDPADRRFLYPFINCTNCGPRYSITRSVPYDRPNTTMAAFRMCPACLKEYHDPRDRRFHAQPNACPECGPEVEYKVQRTEYRVKGSEAIAETVKALKRGNIIAIKGLGGFHIACDATNEKAVRILRERKRKSNKPFAVMMPDSAHIERFCLVSEKEKELLLSNRRPIVLLRKQEGHALSEAVSPSNNYLGCMLPYTPLHYLLFYHPAGQASPSEPNFHALVMTSGNLSEEPIVRDNEDAVKKLSDSVDGFLFHDRDIFMRVDDSVVRVLKRGSGETGKQGKGAVNCSPIHETGPRKNKPFIAINCGAIPENLLESELFGHKKGAFTSSVDDKKGLITMAHTGTLFLDEIGELPQTLQVKLLHVIQTKELTPVGDTRVINVDVRIISATNADLMQRVKEGRFREDLFYRLNVIEIQLPSLRSRRDDIPLLIKFYLAIAAQEAEKNVKDIDYEAMQALLAYDWPGNIRELRNTIERATVLADGEMITIHDLPDKFRTLDVEGISTSSLRQALDEFEREYIRRSLVENKGNKEAAANKLGVDLATLYRKIKKLRIETA